LIPPSFQRPGGGNTAAGAGSEKPVLIEAQPHSHTHPDTPEHTHANGDHHHHHPADEVRVQPVVLDLGEGIGALIVHTDPVLLGTEVEISPAGDDADRQHKEVLKRALGAATVHVLVYDNLPEGDYTLWIADVAEARGVHVQGGSVAELDWRAA
jgi:hypothetical protein